MERLIKTYTAYYRVSTKKQGQSGLGLESQKDIVESFVKNGNIVKEFIEVESGKKNNREQLNKALAYCKENESTLVIAKLDRLSRNAAFIFTLKDSGVDFVCADMPEANTLNIGIFATLAQHERELISQRTKAALAAKKAQGHKLGKPENLSHEAQKKGAQAMKNKSLTNDDNKRAKMLITLLRANGLSYQKIANKLNNNGYKTSTGKKFFASSVQQLEKRNQQS